MDFKKRRHWQEAVLDPETRIKISSQDQLAKVGVTGLDGNKNFPSPNDARQGRTRIKIGISNNRVGELRGSKRGKSSSSTVGPVRFSPIPLAVRLHQVLYCPCLG